jgi:uncharacterized membrane protein YhhN
MKSENYVWVLGAAIFIGLSHSLTWAFPIDHVIVVLWKGASVGALALYSGLNAKNRDGWLLTAALALSALSDVLIVTIGPTEGGIVFMIADMFAIALYARNLKYSLWQIKAWIPLCIIPLASLFGYFIVEDRNEAGNTAIFVLPLATMAAFAWLSNFPRHFVGLGATMVLMSDLLIFARQGPLDGIPALNYAVWQSYFIGEALVCVGVVSTLTHFNKITRGPT